ncbi:hypothetical protein ACI28F_003116 [Escherichia coli]|uniref:hypothetical protein n=1 Tax=Escherichia coli TaxID=562 RepID=UPI0016A6DF20|nr:hypothetical protein [Escherichia coli]EER9977261.1 hypothetical protein [Escherichia coli]EFA1810906.1 hypothetical protein [Escherichia coli]EFJ6526304.1 hypothetical protein [Escherichia coli]EFY6987807.1 hypothetical protein [Escherichia coli]EKE9470861.1 hypothetical protein [Escherichia coli]
MSYLDRVDDEHVERLKLMRIIEHKFASQYAEEHIQFIERELKHKTINERRWIADNVSKMNFISKNRGITEAEQTLLRVTNVLIALGYRDLAKELGTFAEKIYRCVALSEIYIDHIIDGAIKKHRSDSASGPRHHLYDEIVAIIKATWKKEPALSRTKMIAKLSRRYEGRISEETIKCWIKSEKLAPPPPPDKKYKNTELVIPPEYA